MRRQNLRNHAKRGTPRRRPRPGAGSCADRDNYRTLRAGATAPRITASAAQVCSADGEGMVSRRVDIPSPDGCHGPRVAFAPSRLPSMPARPASPLWPVSSTNRETRKGPFRGPGILGSPRLPDERCEFDQSVQPQSYPSASRGRCLLDVVASHRQHLPSCWARPIRERGGLGASSSSSEADHACGTCLGRVEFRLMSREIPLPKSAFRQTKIRPPTVGAVGVFFFAGGPLRALLTSFSILPRG